MGVERSISIAYGITLTSKDAEALVTLFTEYPDDSLAKPADLFYFGPGAGFYREWNLEVDMNHDNWSGSLNEAITVYAPSTYLSLIDTYDMNDEALPLYPDRIRPTVDEEKSLQLFKKKYNIDADPVVVIWGAVT